MIDSQKTLASTWYQTFKSHVQDKQILNIRWCFQLDLAFLHLYIAHQYFCELVLLHYPITAYGIFEPRQVMWCNQRTEIKQLVCDIVVYLYQIYSYSPG